MMKKSTAPTNKAGLVCGGAGTSLEQLYTWPTAQVRKFLMAIPGVSSSSGPSVEATFPFVTSLSKQVRTMLPGQTHIIPGGWIDTETHRFHPALYLSNLQRGLNSFPLFKLL